MLQLVISFEYFSFIFSGVASFSSFAWPKTTLTLETEHGLTSEFGMGSGGSRALWPAYPIDFEEFKLIKFSLKISLADILESSCLSFFGAMYIFETL